MFSDNERERYEKILAVAGKFLSTPEISVMKFGLSLHIHSPKVEMFGQMATERNIPSDCAVAADVGGELACGVEEMNILIKQVS